MGATYGSGVRYASGRRYCHAELLPAYYYTPVDDGEQENRLHYVGVTIKHSNGSLFSIHDIRLVASPLTIEKHQYTVPIDRDGFNRVSLTIKHSDASGFRVDHLRIHGQIRQQRTVR